MQRIDCYTFCKKCNEHHYLTDGDCFPRFKIFTEDTPEEGYPIAARSPEEAAEFYVNGYDEDFELIGKEVIVNVDGVNYKVKGQMSVHYEAVRC